MFYPEGYREWCFNGLVIYPEQNPPGGVENPGQRKTAVLLAEEEEGGGQRLPITFAPVKATPSRAMNTKVPPGQAFRQNRDIFKNRFPSRCLP